LIDCNFTDIEIALAPALTAASGSLPKAIRGSALFQLHSKLNHSCIPNCRAISGAQTASIKLAALTTINPAQELLISYCDTNLSDRLRRRLLKSGYLFACNCKKCSAPSSSV